MKGMTAGQSTTKHLVLEGQATGGSLLTTAAVPMFGFDCVEFCGRIAVAGGNKVRVTVSDDDVAWRPLEDVRGNPIEVDVGQNNAVVALDLIRPMNGRYIRIEIDRSGTATATGDWYACRYGARSRPTTQPAQVELHQFDEPMAAAVP